MRVAHTLSCLKAELVGITFNIVIKWSWTGCNAADENPSPIATTRVLNPLSGTKLTRPRESSFRGFHSTFNLDRRPASSIVFFIHLWSSEEHVNLASMRMLSQTSWLSDSLTASNTRLKVLEDPLGPDVAFAFILSFISRKRHGRLSRSCASFKFFPHVLQKVVNSSIVDSQPEKGAVTVSRFLLV